MKYGKYTITAIVKAQAVFALSDDGYINQHIDTLYNDHEVEEYQAEHEDERLLKAPTIEALKSLIDQQEV